MGDEVKPPSSRFRIPRWAIIAAVVLALLLSPWLALRFHGAVRLQAEIRAIREAGLPVTLEELDAWYPQPPPGENAADLLVPAFAGFDGSWLNQRPGEYGAWRNDGGPMPEEVKTWLREILARNEEALRQVKEGLARLSCRYPVDFRRGPLRLTCDHLGDISVIGHLFEVVDELDPKERPPGLPLRAAELTLALARTLDREPLEYSWHSRNSQLVRGLLFLEKAMSLGTPDRDSLARMERLLEGAENPDGMYRAFIGDRAWKLDAYRLPAEVLSGSSPVYTGHLTESDVRKILAKRAWELRLGGILGLGDLEFAGSLELMRAYMEVSRLPYPDRLAKAKALPERKAGLSVGTSFTGILFLPWKGSFFEEAEVVARLRAGRAALAVERHRQAKGSLPEKLDDLVPTFLPSILRDPFDGAPLRYKRLPGGFSVYSIGTDGADNGGDPTNDVAFTVENPAPER